MINTPKRALEEFLILFDNNKTKCATYLGVSRETIYNWLKKPNTIPLEKAIIIQKYTKKRIKANDLIPILKEISL